MVLSKDTMKDILLGQHYVTEEDWKLSLQFADDETTVGGVFEYFVDRGMLNTDLIREAVAEYFGYTPLFVDREEIDDDVFYTIPEAMAIAQGVFAFQKKDDHIRIGMVDPHNRAALTLVQKLFMAPLRVYSILDSDIQTLSKRYKKDLKQEFAAVVEALKGLSIETRAYDAAVVQTVHMLLEHGYESRASDIHLEPEEEKMVVRYRIDGVLHDMLEVPKQFSEMLLSRIKVLSKMRTDEHRAAQDGKLQFETDKEDVDVRVSVVPVTHGENVVMRLLSSHNRQMSLTDLGFSAEDMKTVENVIQNPHGMILVTGPTGSGKTTSLYAVMKILNKRDIHISTIEDPVEYALEGVSQIQVNKQTNLTFAEGLRAIVRQDPDIIMVGEIRDEETAGIAVNSALTGHLVLSTLHTNDAATTLPRLLDMGVEPFLVASTVNIAIAQRLVRKICTGCKYSTDLTEEEKHMIDITDTLKKYFKKKRKKVSSLRVYKGKGCSVCGGTGYNGRIGVFELLLMTEDIKQLILQRASSDDILALARKNGMRTMMEDGVEKVLAGETTLSEVLRVTSG